MHEQSEALARRLLQEAGSDPRRQVVAGWRLAFGREPLPKEVDAAIEHLRVQEAHFAGQGADGKDKPRPRGKRKDDPRLLALASLCHVLLNTNEFIYVD